MEDTCFQNSRDKVLTPQILKKLTDDLFVPYGIPPCPALTKAVPIVAVAYYGPLPHSCDLF